MCFIERAPGVVHLLVAEGGNHRVQEVDVVRQVHVAFLFVGMLSGPRAVDARAGLIAVSEDRFTDTRVSVFDATTGVSWLGCASIRAPSVRESL